MKEVHEVDIPEDIPYQEEKRNDCLINDTYLIVVNIPSGFCRRGEM